MCMYICVYLRRRELHHDDGLANGSGLVKRAVASPRPTSKLATGYRKDTFQLSGAGSAAGSFITRIGLVSRSDIVRSTVASERRQPLQAGRRGHHHRHQLGEPQRRRAGATLQQHEADHPRHTYAARREAAAPVERPEASPYAAQTRTLRQTPRKSQMATEVCN